MRVDYFHSGGIGREALTLDGVRRNGPWPGSRTHPIDDSNLGAYFFELVDRDTQQVIYSRGYSSIYGEWTTTPEAKTVDRTFHESVRFPWPTRPGRIIFKKRDAENVFQPFWSLEFDPQSTAVDRESTTASGTLRSLVDSGPASDKVDVLLVSEGYTARELPAFHADAARLVHALFEVEPFKSRKASFNVRTLDLPGSRLSVERNIFELPRYMLTYDNRTLRDVLALSPYDLVEILIKDEQYGGGGIFNLQSTVAAGAKGAEYVFVHELAHNFAGLGDEYVGNVTYQTGARVKVEPWEPNITALFDPARLKWRELVEPGTPIPTPLSLAGQVGAFEGAGYEAKGLFRGEADCIMFSRTAAGFCRVCQRAISRAIDSYTE